MRVPQGKLCEGLSNIFHTKLHAQPYKLITSLCRGIVVIYAYVQGRRNWGGQEGQLPPLPFAGRGKGGKSAL